jgi:hypothetical protein
VRKDLEPEDRDTEPLTVEAVVTCSVCSFEFEMVFQAEDGVFETEELEEPIEQQGECPSCGAESMFTYDGWTVHGDAG